MIIATWYKKFFGKLSAFSLPSQIQDSPSCLLVARLQLLSGISDASVLQALNDHITLLQVIGYQVQEEEWQSEMPPEYIGILSCYREGKLEYQRYLKLQVEHYTKMCLVSQKIG